MCPLLSSAIFLGSFHFNILFNFFDSIFLLFNFCRSCFKFLIWSEQMHSSEKRENFKIRLNKLFCVTVLVEEKKKVNCISTINCSRSWVVKKLFFVCTASNYHHWKFWIIIIQKFHNEGCNKNFRIMKNHKHMHAKIDNLVNGILTHFYSLSIYICTPCGERLLRRCFKMQKHEPDNL